MTTLTVSILNSKASRILRDLEDVGLIELDKKNESDDNSIDDVFGTWQSDQSAEEIIRDIYESRTIGWEREPL